MQTNNSFLSLYRTFAAVLLLLAALAAQANQPAGIAMDIQGTAEQSVGGKTTAVKLLDYILTGATITVAEKSTLSLTVYSEKSLYKFSGPASFSISDKGTVVIAAGSKPEVKPLGETLVANVQQSLVSGSTRMRSAMAPIVLLSPVTGSQVSNANPTFMWASAQQGPYTFKLLDDGGKTIWEGAVQDKQWKLPSNVALQPGAKYKWQVSFKSGHGKSPRGQFGVADPAELQALRASAPTATSPIEEHVLYAVSLRNKGYFDEAQKTIEVIYQKRPDLAEAILNPEF